MKKIFICIIFVFLLFVAYPFSVSAIDVCVVTEQKLSKIKGIVKDRNYFIPNAELILKREKKDEILQKVRTDEKGYFEFSPLLKGKYILVVSYPNAKTLYIPIRLTKNRKGDKKSLEIIMQFTIGGCDEEVRTI